MGDDRSPGQTRAAQAASDDTTVQVLGLFRVHRRGRTLLLPRRLARVVAYLAVHGATTRQQLAGRLWPDSPQPRAAADLRTALWRLQKLAAELVQPGRGAVGLAETVGVDLPEVEAWALRAIAAATRPDGGMEQPPAGATRTLLAGWDEDWLDHPRERLRMLRLQAFESTGYRLLAAGRPAEALPYALHVVHADPLRESGNRLMIEVHLRQGNLVEATQRYRRYRRLLREELAIEPGVGISSLIQSAAPGVG